MCRLLIVLALCGLVAGPALADVVINETDLGLPDDDFSDSHNAPTDIGSLGVGLTTVNGVIVSVDLPDPDIFTFTIDVGRVLDSVSLLSIDGDGHFFGIDEGNVSVDPNTGNGNDLLVATLVGGSDVGTNWLTVPSAGQVFKQPGAPATGPLGPGDYTIWIQENNPEAVGYSIGLNVSPVSIPEPSSLIALGFAGACLTLRRRRRG